jgi:hypothetical protein
MGTETSTRTNVFGFNFLRALRQPRHVDQERGQLLFAEEVAEINVLPDRLQFGDVPIEVQFSHAVIGDGEGLRFRVFCQVEVGALDGDQLRAIRPDDQHIFCKVGLAGSFEGLIASDHAPFRIQQNRAPCSVITQGFVERLASARGPFVGIALVQLQVGELHRGDYGRGDHFGHKSLSRCAR